MMEYLYTSTYTTQGELPEFSLSLHNKVFCLAISLNIPGLEVLAAERYRHTLQNHITDLQVYFSSVKRIYATTSSKHPGLRMAVVEAAIMEMKKILDHEGVKKHFFDVMADVPDYQVDIMMTLIDNPHRPVEVAVQQLCSECGPASEEEPYVVEMKCRNCGEEKTLEFL
jgi:hypothetical protein